MNIFKSATIACALVASTSVFAAERGSSEMPTPYFDELNAKLIADGYRDVRVIDAGKHKLIAFYRDGSEMILIAHPTNRTILSTSYVHGSDS